MFPKGNIRNRFLLKNHLLEYSFTHYLKIHLYPYVSKRKHQKSVFTNNNHLLEYKFFSLFKNLLIPVCFQKETFCRLGFSKPVINQICL